MNIKELKTILNNFPEEAEVYPYLSQIKESNTNGIGIRCEKTDKRAFINTELNTIEHNSFQEN